VLTASAGFADLEQHSLLALGNVTIHHRQPFALEQLLAVYGGAFTAHGAGLSADLPEETLQIALGTEAEAAGDRFVRQLATYDSMSQAGMDPLWTAVTGYYAGFFAANALMLACGRGVLRVDRAAITAAQARGLHRVNIRPGVTFGQLQLSLTPITGPASHQATWAAVRDLLNDLAATAGNGQREELTFSALAAMIVGPNWLSRERNDINYDFKRNPFLAGFWPRELPSLIDEAAVENRILTIVAPRPEQRFELVMAGCASLFFGLGRSFRARGGKIDPQRRKRRQEAMTACPALSWLVA
jgi:hypothetical protein